MKLLKKQIVLLIFCLFVIVSPEMVNAQCPDRPGKPVLRDQEAVDSFLAIYPNCDNYIEGYRAIDGVPIYWVYEDVQNYLFTLGGLIIVILGLLKLLFSKAKFFQE